MRILIVGAGAVGGYLGFLLVRAGVETAFLVRAARAEQLAATGLVVVHPMGRRTAMSVETVTADRLGPGWDLVILAVKATVLDAALDDIAPAVASDTAILPILNGVDHIDIVSARYGRSRMLGGVAVVATELTDLGEIALLAPGASLRFGEFEGQQTIRTSRVADALGRADLDLSVSDSILQEMWEKWLFMAAGGAATTLLGGAVGRIVSMPGGTRTVERLIDEVVTVQRAFGYGPRAAALSRITAVLTRPGSEFTTSMYRDAAAHRSTEVEPILGSLLARAALQGISVPLLEAAACRLRLLEAP